MRGAHALQNQCKDWLYSFVSSLAAFVIIYILCPVQFDSNDDSAIQMILSGSMSGGEPEGQLVFINRWFGFAISQLFRAVPSIPWWALVHILILFLSVLLTNYALAVLYRWGWRRHSRKGCGQILIGLQMLFDLSLFLYPIARMQFSITSSVAPACVAFSIIVLAFCGRSADMRSHFSFTACFISVLITVCAACMRFESAVIACFYAVLAGGYVAISSSSDMQTKKRVIAVLALGAVLVLIGYVADKNSYDSSEWETFLETDRQRSGFMDYPHATYAEDAELYESVGWNEETYNLVTNWCFMLDSVNGESFGAINRLDPAAANSSSLSWIRDFFWREGQFNSLPFVAYTIAMISLGIAICYRCVSRSSQMLVVCCTLLCFILWSVLSAMGRFIFRAAFSPMFATIMLILAVLLVSGDKKDGLISKRMDIIKFIRYIGSGISVALIISMVEQSGGMGRVLYFVPAATCCIGTLSIAGNRVQPVFRKLIVVTVLLPGLFSLYRLNRSSDDFQIRREQDLHFECMLSYAKDHGDEIFVVPTLEGSTTNPWKTEFPTNVYPMGGWPFYMPWRQDQMLQGDGTLLELDDLIDGKSIRLLTSSDWSLGLITDYLNTREEGVLVEKCDELSLGENIYQFKTS